jgi:hypothetical protein
VKAGIAREEFHTARPHTTARPKTNPGRGGGESRRSIPSAATRGKPVTRGMRKFGGGPVAVISAM